MYSCTFEAVCLASRIAPKHIRFPQNELPLRQIGMPQASIFTHLATGARPCPSWSGVNVCSTRPFQSLFAAFPVPAAAPAPARRRRRQTSQGDYCAERCSRILRGLVSTHTCSSKTSSLEVNWSTILFVFLCKHAPGGARRTKSVSFSIGKVTSGISFQVYRFGASSSGSCCCRLAPASTHDSPSQDTT